MILSITEFVGRFHPLLVHLPIGVLLLALVLQWLPKTEQYRLPSGVTKVVWTIGIASALFSCITGYLLSLSGGYQETTVTVHMWMGIGVAVVSGLIGFRVVRRQSDSIYKAACIVLLILITGAGHFGGSLTHGDDYLTAALGSGDRNKITEVIEPVANVQEINMYAGVIQPILQTKCYSCHSSQKQKGKLRMDGPEFLMTGGDEGKIILPGKAEESELIRRAILAETDDHHMPPKGKPQLTKAQLALLHWWIEQGASFNKKVKELPQDEKIKPLLAALENGGQQEKKIPEFVPVDAVDAADINAVQALRNKGVVVMPVAQNSNYLTVNFVTAADISDKDLQLLEPLKKQLLWLKLNDAPIGDAGLSYIGKCTALRTLQLNNTNVTDKGLKQLTSLKALTTLSLAGTRITAEGLLALKDLPAVSAIYLFETDVQKRNFAELKKAFPNSVLDTGGYKVPTLVTDTTILVPKKTTAF